VSSLGGSLSSIVRVFASEETAASGARGGGASVPCDRVPQDGNFSHFGPHVSDG
jgi:hypothetical protein